MIFTYKSLSVVYSNYFHTSKKSSLYYIHIVLFPFSVALYLGRDFAYGITDGGLQPSRPATDSRDNLSALRDNKLSAIAAENLLVNLFGNLVNREQVDTSLLESVGEFANERGSDEMGVDDGGENLIGVVNEAKFAIEGFVEGKGRCLGAGVIGGLDKCNKGGDTGNSNNVTLVVGDHVGEELLAQGPVRHAVNSENLLQEVVWHVHDGHGLGDTSVVDEDGRVSQLLANALAGFGHRLGRRYVALEEANVGIVEKSLGWRLEVEDGYLDTAREQALGDALANATAAAGDDGNLRRPVPAGSWRQAPCIAGTAVQHTVHIAHEAKTEKDLKDRLGCRDVIIGRQRDILEQVLADVFGDSQESQQERAGE